MKPIQIPSFMSTCIGTTIIELREFKEKKEHGQNGKTIFSSNLKKKWYFSEIFHSQFCLDMLYALKSSI